MTEIETRRFALLILVFTAQFLLCSAGMYGVAGRDATGRRDGKSRLRCPTRSARAMMRAAL